MGKLRRKLTSAFKKAMGASSSRSHVSSNARYTEPKESLMYEEETEPTEEQEQQMEEDDDDPLLDLEGA